MKADKVKVIVEAQVNSAYRSERDLAKHLKRILGEGYKISGFNAVMCRLGKKRKARPKLRVIRGGRKAA